MFKTYTTGECWILKYYAVFLNAHYKSKRDYQVTRSRFNVFKIYF